MYISRPELLLAAQAKDANGLQKALANNIGNYQLLEGEAGPGQLQNVVDVTPFLKVRAIAGCEADKTAPARDKTLVNIQEARIELFGLRCAPIHAAIVTKQQYLPNLEWQIVHHMQSAGEGLL